MSDLTLGPPPRAGCALARGGARTYALASSVMDTCSLLSTRSTSTSSCRRGPQGASTGHRCTMGQQNAEGARPRVGCHSIQIVHLPKCRPSNPPKLPLAHRPQKQPHRDSPSPNCHGTVAALLPCQPTVSPTRHLSRMRYKSDAELMRLPSMLRMMSPSMSLRAAPMAV